MTTGTHSDVEIAGTCSVTQALPVQAAMLALASAVAVVPPPEGNMIILPVLPGNSDATFRWAIGSGALPVALGPYPGSIVVRASLSEIALPAISHGALPITARFAGCGSYLPKERS